MGTNIFTVSSRKFISAEVLPSERKLDSDSISRTSGPRNGGMGAVHCHEDAQAQPATRKSSDHVLDVRLGCMSAAPLFRGLSLPECSEIAGAAREQRFLRGQSIFSEDDPVRCIFVIVDGRVKITQISQAGKEVILRVDGPGALVDGLGTLSPVHTTTAYAVDPCHVLAWGVGVFDTFARRYPAIPRNAIGIMAERLKKLEVRFCDVSTGQVPQRLARVLIQLVEQCSTPGSSKPVGLSREELAQMTGTTLFTVSRLLRDWAEQEIVQVDRRNVLVEQLPRLIRLADDGCGPGPVQLSR